MLEQEAGVVFEDVPSELQENTPAGAAGVKGGSV
jgi:hypothetical protein